MNGTNEKSAIRRIDRKSQRKRLTSQGVCPDCKHSLVDNNHGFDQNDGYLDERNRLVHSGRCTYCKECNPALAKALNEVGK